MHAPIKLFQQVDSTNNMALEAAREGAPHGSTWVADQQLNGRGRRDPGGERRSWHSPAGENIYMSTVVRPTLAAEEASKITVAVGLSVAATLRDAAGIDIWLKWPNDLLVGDRKLAGILTEGVFENGTFAAAVVGMGINVLTHEADVPSELDGVMTSLHMEAGRDFDRMALVFQLQNAVVQGANLLQSEGLLGFAQLLSQVDRSAGRKVRVGTGGNVQVGVAHGIDLATGGLKVEIDGSMRLVTTGEAKLVR